MIVEFKLLRERADQVIYSLNDIARKAGGDYGLPVFDLDNMDAMRDVLVEFLSNQGDVK